MALLLMRAEFMTLTLWMVGIGAALFLLFIWCLLSMAKDAERHTPDFPDRRDAMKQWREELLDYYQSKGLRQVK
jgi:hypothetical protein